MEDKILVNLIHPTDSTQILSVNVPRGSTTAWLVTQMINAGFIPPPGQSGQYKLMDTRSSLQMNDGQTLGSAGSSTAATSASCTRRAVRHGTETRRADRAPPVRPPGRLRHARALFDFEAYRTSADLESSSDPVARTADAGEASKYRMTLRVPTLIGPGEFRPETVFGVDLDVRDYPLAEPLTWIISDPVPWSPHFQKGSPICIGAEFWTARKGHVTLGDLVIHVARLLNWDEKGRGGGYVGWNPEADQPPRRALPGPAAESRPPLSGAAHVAAGRPGRVRPRRSRSSNTAGRTGRGVVADDGTDFEIVARRFDAPFRPRADYSSHLRFTVDPGLSAYVAPDVAADLRRLAGRRRRWRPADCSRAGRSATTTAPTCS